MRKGLFALLVVALVAFASIPCMAANNYGTDNAFLPGGGMGPSGITPYSKIVKVRYGFMTNKGGEAGVGSGLSSGDVVVWDDVSDDGYTVSACTASFDPAYCGVMVTSVTTADSILVSGNGPNIGYACIEGYCLAKVDSTATAGEALHLTAANTFMTNAIDPGYPLSKDNVGICLTSPTTTGLAPVILR